MPAYLMIQNPGVAPPEAFTLLGASTKRDSDNPSIVGKFGTGNKLGVAVLLRHQLVPVVFAGSLKMEFGTRKQVVNDGLKDTVFNRVVVKYGGKDAGGINRSSTDDLGYVLEHGSSDWTGVDLALREFVSNSIDRSIDQGEHDFTNSLDKDNWDEHDDLLVEYRKTAVDYKDVVVEVVAENQVRAKSGYTRVFVPLNADVLQFYNNLGKWFLHFSEPALLGVTILPKSGRNIGDRNSAVIYRRGVRVREFESSDTASLFDYNLDNLNLNESRRVDDWYVQHEAAKALSEGSKDKIVRLWQSFVDGGTPYWEHGFTSYGLDGNLSDSQNEVWNSAFEQVAGNSVLSTVGGADMVTRKGHQVVYAPEPFVKIAERRGIRTPAKVLTDDEKSGREIFDPTADALAAVEFAWNLVVKYSATNGRTKPKVKSFRKVMAGGSQTLGFYKDGVVFINQDIASNGALSLGWFGLNQQLLVTALEEVSHHVTGATDNSRDFQDFLLNLVVYSAKDIAGIS